MRQMHDKGPIVYDSEMEGKEGVCYSIIEFWFTSKRQIQKQMQKQRGVFILWHHHENEGL